MSRRAQSRRPTRFQKRVVVAVEDGFALRARGFGEASVDCDRAELVARWKRADLELVLSFYGLERVERLGMSVVPGNRGHAFALRQAVEVLDPSLHERGSSMQWEEWVAAHADFVEARAAELFDDAESVFEVVKRAAPLGPQLRQLIEMCREELGLEREHGFAAPSAWHWGHECEVSFERAPVRLVVRLEDHENAGVTAEPFTVPELWIVREGVPETSVTALAARLAPDHAAKRPIADRYAMALSAVRPWLAHDAVFLRRHADAWT